MLLSSLGKKTIDRAIEKGGKLPKHYCSDLVSTVFDMTQVCSVHPELSCHSLCTEITQVTDLADLATNEGIDLIFSLLSSGYFNRCFFHRIREVG
ncbi:MAG: hypothetical protein JWM46_536 [Candidatus Kaiserbacteria bacterium]|nr:hypothetical protein [Candidatus Kaiserbacteria bacterium]